jgi:competence protein ComGC
MFKHLHSRQHAAFSLAEVAITLGAVAVLIGITLPMAIQSSESLQQDVNRARVKGLYANLRDAISQYQMDGKSIESADYNDIFDNLQYSRKLTSGSLILDPAPRGLNGAIGEGSTTYALAPTGRHAYQLKSGGILVVESQDFSNASLANCVGNRRRAMHALYDPDGENTGAADSIHLFIYEDGAVRSLETLGSVNTCVHGDATQAAVANADPDYLD